VVGSLQTEVEKLKTIYYEIVRGHTFIPELDVYIKHFSELENIEIANKKQLFYNQYIKEGIPSYEERMKMLNEIGEWTKADEENIIFLRGAIIDNEKNIPTMTMMNKVIPEQQEYLKQIIKDKKKELTTALLKKRSILGATAEEFSERDTINYMTYRALQSSNNKPLFESFDDFLELDDDLMETYIVKMDEAVAKFDEQNIRKIAVMPFFINMFSYTKENVFFFFNKAMIELTNFQFMLISLGSRNLGVLQNCDKEPPEILEVSDLDKLVSFYDMEFSVLLGKRHTTRPSQNRVVVG
jgi:hypothetical protein